ncbi:MAG TPA: hypothetical protein PLC40_16220 [Candidatus Hydrogenedentes bacterium]|nr:hypothetical protein [Candidatus Hydrogenedentota bacterium]
MKSVFTTFSTVLVLVMANIAAGQGVNFSVKLGSQGMPGTGVATQAMLEAPENDVFIGGGCTDFTRLLHVLLGLQPGDDIDALHYPQTPIKVLFQDMPGDEAGWLDAGGGLVVACVKKFL